MYKGLRRVWDEYKAIGVRAVATRDQLATNILRFEASKECRKNRILSVQVLPHSGSYVELQASVCNANGECSTDVELRLAVTINHQDGLSSSSSLGGGPDPFAPVVDRESVMLSGDNGLEPSPIAIVDGAYVAFWDYIEPGQTAILRMRVQVPFVGPATSVTACASATVEGVAVPADPAYQTVCVTAAFVAPAAPQEEAP